MADNPFDPKRPLGSLLTPFPSPPPPQRHASLLARLLAASKARPSNALSAAASDLLGSNPKAPTNALGSAASDLFGSAPSPFNALVFPKPPIKRRAFFSFHFEDSMRVNNVRNIWKISHPNSETMRSFEDSSLWESRKLESLESIKRLITDGVKYTSAVCVLIGTQTWGRRWVRYEMARAVIDGRGLLGVHLNSIRHHRTQMTNLLGLNPLDFMAIGKVQANVLLTPRYFLFERVIAPNGRGGHQWVWNRYGDHTSEVSLPKWLRDPPAGCVTALSEGASVYDFMRDEGHKNIGAWIDLAAQLAGR